MKVVFFGTPDFALPSLQALYDSGNEVVAVVTQPDRERDRRKITFSPVKELALKLGIPVLQYERVSKEGVEDLTATGADLFVTCAYGQIMSQKILDIPPLGTINVHASLLPRYRGSSPIQWALIEGERETGITIMKTVLAVDAGDILMQSSVRIGDRETAGELFDRLACEGGKLLARALDVIGSGKAVYTPQDESKATHYPMLSKSDGKLDFSQSAVVLDRRIRGLTPWPSAFTTLEGKMFKILCAEPRNESAVHEGIGRVTVLGSDMFITCGEGALQIYSVQLEGGKKLSVADFLRGHNPDGVVLGK